MDSATARAGRKSVSDLLIPLDDEVSEHLSYLFGDPEPLCQGNIALFTPGMNPTAKARVRSVSPKAVRKQQRTGVMQFVVAKKDLARIISYMGPFNLSVSLHTYYRNQRGSNLVKQYRCVAVDLDCHKVGLTPKAAPKVLEDRYFGPIVPTPTFIAASLSPTCSKNWCVSSLTRAGSIPTCSSPTLNAPPSSLASAPLRPASPLRWAAHSPRRP